MPILTLEAIRKNPWNAVTHTLPEHPMQLLLEAAFRAAEYCRRSECELMIVAYQGRYTPLGWMPGDPDVHEESEARSFEADLRLTEISKLHAREFGETLEEFEGQVSMTD